MSDARYIKENQTIAICTGRMDKKVTLDEDGCFFIEALCGSGRDFAAQKVLSEEFSIMVDGICYTGSTGGWTLTGVTSKERAKDELEVLVTLKNDVLEVERHYIAYAGTGVIGEYTVYRNLQDHPVKVSRPSIWQARLAGEDFMEFGYLPGGANFTGSWVYKTVLLDKNYQRSFDSHGKSEVMEVEGETINDQHPVPNGTGIWHEFYTLYDQKQKEGLCLTFDYQGWWKSDICQYEGVTSLKAWCEVEDYLLEAGETFTTPNANTVHWQGDLDDLGNTISDFVYTYKWDFVTRYFGQTTATIWREAPLSEQVFRMVNYGRYIGVEQIHVDDFWFDAKGNWNGVFGDDWKHNNDYIRRNGMDFRFWMPPWHADRLSKVWLDHPEWMLNWHGNWYNWSIDLSQEEAYQWILNMLCEKQKEFGAYMLRVDGNPTMSDKKGNYNCAHIQSENFYRLYKEFKEKNPDAGLNGCSSGGHTLTIESVRYTDTQQITDGYCRHYGNYYATLFNPVDKVAGFGYGIMMQNTLDEDYTEEFLEKQRKSCERARWLRQAGITFAPYAKVYRPEVLHGDKTFYFQQMTGDCRRGILRQTGGKNPYLGKSEIIYPKGLVSDVVYTIDSELGSVDCETKTGKEWMQDGIRIRKVTAGEIIYFNVQDRPGMGTDRIPPTTPEWIRATEECWMGHKGIGVEWASASDNVMVSYYQLYKNGQPFTKISTGTFYFDLSEEVGEYSVCAVDCDGNRSEVCYMKGEV